MTKKSEKLIVDPDLGNVLFRKSIRSRRVSIRIHPVKGISVMVPYLVPYAVAIAFFKSHRSRIIDKSAEQKARYSNVPVCSKEEIEQMRRKAKKELPERLAVLAFRYDFTYNRVAIKHNSTNWGSCSAKNNINLNLNLVRLPRVLCDYVLLHELCHLSHHDHGESFHLLLEHMCSDNISRLVEEGDPLAREMAEKAASSRARYPLDKVCSRALKQYPLV